MTIALTLNRINILNHGVFQIFSKKSSVCKNIKERLQQLVFLNIRLILCYQPFRSSQQNINIRGQTQRVTIKTIKLINHVMEIALHKRRGFPLSISSANTTKSRSSHQRCSLKKLVLRNFTKFTEKNLCQSLVFDKVY